MGVRWRLSIRYRGSVAALADRWRDGSTVRRKLRGVSEQPVSEAVPVLEELACAQYARPVDDIAELRADVWDSDEELDEFLADWRATRNASLS